MYTIDMNKTPQKTIILQDQSTNTAAVITVDDRPDLDNSRPSKPKVKHIDMNRPLTGKQRQFITNIVDKKMTKTDAYIDAYNTKGNKATVYAEASKTTSKPQVKLMLDRHSQIAESTLVDIMQYSREYGRDNSKEGASYASVSVAVAKDILDRVHGKATQRTEIKSEAVVLNIDLTGVTPSSP